MMMSNDVLSQEAMVLLKQLRSAPCLGAFDRAAAEELVSRGLAVRVPTTGEIEVTEAGRAGSLESKAENGADRSSAATVSSVEDTPRQDEAQP